MQERPLIAPFQRQKLVEIFDKDLAILGDWLGFYPSCEQFYPATALDTDLDTENQSPA
jgi:hypothetical protein